MQAGLRITDLMEMTVNSGKREWKQHLTLLLRYSKCLIWILDNLLKWEEWTLSFFYRPANQNSARWSGWMEVLPDELWSWWDLSEVFHYLTYVSLLLARSQLSQPPFQNKPKQDSWLPRTSLPAALLLMIILTTSKAATNIGSFLHMVPSALHTSS